MLVPYLHHVSLVPVLLHDLFYVAIAASGYLVEKILHHGCAKEPPPACVLGLLVSCCQNGCVIVCGREPAHVVKMSHQQRFGKSHQHYLHVVPVPHVVDHVLIVIKIKIMCD